MAFGKAAAEYSFLIALLVGLVVLKICYDNLPLPALIAAIIGLAGLSWYLLNSDQRQESQSKKADKTASFLIAEETEKEDREKSLADRKASKARGKEEKRLREEAKAMADKQQLEREQRDAAKREAEAAAAAGGGSNGISKKKSKKQKAEERAEAEDDEDAFILRAAALESAKQKAAKGMRR